MNPNALLVVVAAGWLVGGTPIARAQSSNEPPRYTPPPPAYPPRPVEPLRGFHRHDGFFLRLATGLSALHASWKEGSNDYAINGTGIALGMAFGGALTPNLVLYGEITGVVARDPTQKLNGASTTLTDYDVSFPGIGPGAAYYLMPANVYFSGTLAFFRLTQGYHGPSPGSEGTGGDGRIITNLGVGAAVVMGKDWWVSTNWSLGVAGLVHLAWMEVRHYHSHATAEAYSLLFSATYN
jgi:hypothetical protein